MKRLPVILLILVLFAALQLDAVYAQQGSHKVAILIVDDFTGVDLSAVQVPSDQTDCAVNIEGQAYIHRGASAGQPIDTPHGELVYSQLASMVSADQADSYITLHKIDIRGFRPDNIVAAINQAMANNPADVYIVNMSFVLIPCQSVKQLADLEKQLDSARKTKDTAKYRSTYQLAALYFDQQVFPANLKKYQKKTGVDPLQDFFAAHASNVVAIASAGNFGLDYPFWPAAWEQVVSVSASTGEGFSAPAAWDKKTNLPLLGADVEEKGKKGTRISNFGEIMLPGEYTIADYGVIMGTSFSAPRLSMKMALYLSSVGTNYCRKRDGGPAFAYGGWNNMTLEEATAAYCPDMKPFVLTR